MNTLAPEQLNELAELAIQAALKAGQAIQAYRHREITVQKKTAGNTLASQVVTEVDLISQKIIVESLYPSLEHFNIALLTEETEDDHSRLKKPCFWSIDPLDGTLAFIEQQDGFAVSIGLVAHSGEPLIGVIYNPAANVLYHAVKNSGAFRNHQPWQLPVSKKNKALTLVNDSSFRQAAYYNDIIDYLTGEAKKSGYDGLKSIMHGGAVMNACWVLENAPACYFKFPKKQPGGGSLWDYAASACLFSEIRAYVSDIHGAALELNRQQSTFMNHRGILYTSHANLKNSIQRYFHTKLAES
jgi:3'-phosphoadenosine 5'-phosphosulfate (PAPS) 3'-phosphatase